MEIPGFQILDQLGEGPMSTVWKAHQISLNRIVAIKVLKQKFTVRPNEVHPVLKEARTAAALKHPNIIPIYDAGEIDGTFYFVMEFIAGSTLGQLIQKKGTISQKSTLNAALLVIEALDHAWKTANLVHRGLNPDNIMIDADGTVKVADLGLAKMSDPAHLSVQLREGTVKEKLNYTSPEQAKCSIRIDFRTDMYGLGATLYHMITGKMPFSEFGPKEVLNQQLTGFLKNPRDIVPATSIGMAHIISTLMMKDYKARYANWSDVVADIKKASSSKVKIVKPPVEDGVEPPVSTILPAQEPEPVAAPKKRFTLSSAAADDEPDPDAPPPLRIPWYVQLPVWVLMLGWWSFLMWSQLRLPALVLPPEPVASTTTAERRTPSSSSPSPGAPRQPETPRAQPTGPTRAPVPTAEDPEKQNLDSFKAGIAASVASGEIDRALAMIAQEEEYNHSKDFTADLKSMRDMLTDARRAIESALLKKLGQELTINDKGQSRRVTVRGMSGGVISADYAEKVGDTKVTKTLSIPVTKVDPAELIRTIGADNTPGKSLMKYSLCIKQGEFYAAKKAAANCPPLSEWLIKAADANKPGAQE